MMDASPCCNCDYTYIPTPSGEASEYECSRCESVFYNEHYVFTEEELNELARKLYKVKSIEGIKRVLSSELEVYDDSLDEYEDE